MGSRKGGQTLTIRVKGADELSAFMRDEIAREDLNVAKRELRQGSKKIAAEIFIPALKRAAASSGVPIAPAMADTARAQSDRLVVVMVGKVNPKLSGFRKGVGSKKGGAGTSSTGRVGSKTSQGYRTTLAFGSNLGPHPAASRNRYGVSRSGSGYYVQPAIVAAFSEVKKAYNNVLSRILADYGKYR